MQYGQKVSTRLESCSIQWLDFSVGCPKFNSLTGLVNKQLAASGPAVGVFNPVLSFFGNSYFYLVYYLLSGVSVNYLEKLCLIQCSYQTAALQHCHTFEGDTTL